MHNIGEVILPIDSGGVSSRTFTRPCHLLTRIVVAPQQDSYRFVTTPQPTDAMLHRMHAWEGGCLRRGGLMRLLGMFDAPKRVRMVGVRG
jgi:hypothetical protein